MKMLDLHNKVFELALGTVDCHLENSEGILKVKRGKKVLEEKDKFEFLKYYAHY